ncbi:MAG: hypothetical protein K0R76_1236 [Alphaproteobacteria bacterium]|jgi:hypothetical protein|nr:hypothetical protein [Alphaproteobacteria bacterium]
MDNPILTEQQAAEAQADPELLREEEVLDTLTTYFRRTSRGRIVDLPRWAQ